MAVATGAWSNSSESCEAKWDNYVKENKELWEVCNEINGPDGYSILCGASQDTSDEGRRLDEDYFRKCQNSHVLIIASIYDLKRKEFIDECSRHSDFNHFNQGVPKLRAKRKQRKHHYIFDIDDKGVDFSGFIIHTANKQHHGHRLKAYLDANDNGRFDKKDELIGTSKLKNMYSHKGIGGILDSGEIAKVEVEFKRKPSMRTDDSSAPLAGEGDVTLVGSSATAIVAGILFYAVDESIVSNITPIGILENFGDG